MGDGTLGIFKDGKYLSEAERKAKEKEADEKKNLKGIILKHVKCMAKPM